MKKILGVAFGLAFSALANSAVIEFVPPNDVSGQVYTTNSNDGWSNGRGLVFQMLDTVTIDSLGFYQDLTGINVSYEIAQVLSPAGNVTSGQTVLASGGGNATTNGLEWVDYAISDLLLTAGNYYHVEFTFSGNSNQNFFYNNGNSAFSQGSYDLLDGTQNGSTSNFVMAAFRLNEVNAQVSEPASVALLGLGLLGLGYSRRKSQA